MSIDEASVVRAGRAIDTLEVDGQALVIDEAAGRAHALNPTASVVWLCLDGTVDLGGLVDELADAFAGPRDAIAADVLTLVQTCGRLGQLEGIDLDPAALPQEPDADDEDACAPDATFEAGSPFDDRYLAAPPNG